jgi:tripartite-type tricarboxylate transporter receptor subunit TctC
VHVPFKGFARATTALLAGQVDFSLADASAIPHIESGKMRGLAVTTASPSPLFRGVPTIAEAGVPWFRVSAHGRHSGSGGYAARGDSQDQRRAQPALGNEGVRRRLNAVGFDRRRPRRPNSTNFSLSKCASTRRP